MIKNDYWIESVFKTEYVYRILYANRMGSESWIGSVYKIEYG